MMFVVQNDPGPGHYTRIKTAPAAGSGGSHHKSNRVSFGCSSERFNRQSQQNFSGVTVSVCIILCVPVVTCKYAV